MKIFSAAASLCLQLSMVATAVAGQREDALHWASEHRAPIYKKLLPAATDDVSMPICRLTTVRSSGSLDTFEFLIRIVEDCPVVDPTTGKIAPAEVRAALIVPEGSPIDDQLASMRLADPALTPEVAVPRIKLRTVSLAPHQARKLLQQLAAFPASLLPPIEIALDARTYEVTSSTGIQTRLVTFAERSSSKSDRQLARIVTAVLTSLGYRPEKLRYDPAAWADAPAVGKQP